MTIISEYIVQDKEEQDEILHRRGFDVNIRLYNSNVVYRRLIQSVIQYMMSVKNTSFDDYSKVKGISGANIGIPLNIIIAQDKIMLNPKIIDQSYSENVFHEATCGSVPNTKLLVGRPYRIIVEYFNLEGKKIKKTFYKNVGTICHEIEHNLGILITDRRVYNE